jgi:hypothetical protein
MVNYNVNGDPLQAQNGWQFKSLERGQKFQKA